MSSEAYPACESFVRMSGPQVRKRIEERTLKSSDIAPSEGNYGHDNTFHLSVLSADYALTEFGKVAVEASRRV